MVPCRGQPKLAPWTREPQRPRTPGCSLWTDDPSTFWCAPARFAVRRPKTEALAPWNGTSLGFSLPSCNQADQSVLLASDSLLGMNSRDTECSLLITGKTRDASMLGGRPASLNPEA